MKIENPIKIVRGLRVEVTPATMQATIFRMADNSPVGTLCRRRPGSKGRGPMWTLHDRDQQVIYEGWLIPRGLQMLAERLQTCS